MLRSSAAVALAGLALNAQDPPHMHACRPFLKAARAPGNTPSRWARSRTLALQLAKALRSSSRPPSGEPSQPHRSPFTFTRHGASMLLPGRGAARALFHADTLVTVVILHDQGSCTQATQWVDWCESLSPPSRRSPLTWPCGGSLWRDPWLPFALPVPHPFYRTLQPPRVLGRHAVGVATAVHPRV